MAFPPAPPFLLKTYAMVDDPETDDTISWNESGTAFVVWRRAEFESVLLPRNFKHSNFASFVRQLNTYGFRKVGLDRWEFANDCFRRGEKRLLGAIHRRKGTGVVPAASASATIPTAIPISPTPTSSGGDPAVSSSPPPGPGASCGAMAELEEENARLRRENARLARELARALRVCDGVRHLVSRYDRGGGEEEDERTGGKPPMLLGAAAIRSKRSREDGDGEDGAEENGEDEDEEQEEDEEGERHGARREAAKSRRKEPSDLDVLALSVRAAAAARPDGDSRDRKNPSAPKPLGLGWH